MAGDELDSVTQEFIADMRRYEEPMKHAMDDAVQFAAANRLATDELITLGARANATADDINALAESAKDAKAKMLEMTAASVAASAATSGGGGGAGIFTLGAAGMTLLVAALAAAAPALVAVGMGFVAFGAVAFPVLKNVFTAVSTINTDLQNVQNATTAIDKQKALAQYAKDWGALPPQVQAVVTAIQQLQQGFNLAQSLGIDKQIYADIAKGINTITSIIPHMIPLIKAGSASFQMFFNAIMKGISSKGFFDFINQMSKLIVPATGQILKMASTLMGFLGKALLTIAPISVPFLKFLNALLTALSPIIITVLKLLVVVLGDLFKALQPLIGPLGKMIDTVFKALSSTIQQLLPPIMRVVTVLVQSLVPVFRALTPVLVQIASNMGPLIPIVKILASVLAFVIPIVAKIIVWLLHLVGHILNVTTTISGASKAWDHAWKFITMAASAAWSTIKATFDAITGGVDHVAYWFSQLPGKILGYLGHLASDLWNIGVHLMEGLIGGITHMMGSLGSTIGHVAGSILHSIGSFLGIGSPSRITYQHGIWLMQGLANGVLAAVPTAVGAMQTAAGRISAAVRGSISVNPLTMGLAGGAGGGPAFAGAGPVTQHLNLTMMMPDGQATTQKATLVYNRHNPTNGLTVRVR